mmetsp:Transcript_3828/g.8261  ORF Transcript_3828/g.8261 Transcript_3828/m.8261 type:complete len:218 (+) Transcript_3828:715-1368(+)
MPVLTSEDPVPSRFTVTWIEVSLVLRSTVPWRVPDVLRPLPIAAGLRGTAQLETEVADTDWNTSSRSTKPGARTLLAPAEYNAASTDFIDSALESGVSTPQARTPAAHAARISSGVSPTITASEGATPPRRSSARRTGAGLGFDGASCMQTMIGCPAPSETKERKLYRSRKWSASSLGRPVTIAMPSGHRLRSSTRSAREGIRLSRSRRPAVESVPR